jgi:hypothetical protein
MDKGIKKKMVNNIEARIPVIFFEEGDKIIAYSPAIDLSTCGDTEEQARKRFGDIATIFFDEITQMGTVDEVLAECGWSKDPHKHSWSPPKYRSYSEELIQIPEGAH